VTRRTDHARCAGGRLLLCLVSSFYVPTVAWADGRDSPTSTDIIVTATRQETTLSKTPLAVTSVSGKAMQDAGITYPSALTDVVPNLSIDWNLGLRITIRGVTSEGNNPSVGFFQDGVYIARAEAQDVAFFDLERVEVLRGPQGVFYGRNTSGGAINLISALPKHDFQLSVSAAGGNYSAANVSATLNAPVGDWFAVRLALNYDRRDNYVRKADNTPFSLDPFRDVRSGRLTVLADVTPNLKFIVRADYANQGGVLSNSVPASNFFPAADVSGLTVISDADPVFAARPPDQQRFTSFPEAWQSFHDDKFWGVMGQLDWTLGPLAVTYVGAHRETRLRAHLSLNGGLIRAKEDDFRGWQDTHELRATFGANKPLHGQFGLSYFREQSRFALFLLDPEILFQQPDGSILPFAIGASQFGLVGDPSTARALSGFGQVGFDFTPNFHLAAGIRYSDDMQSRSGALILDTAFLGRLSRVNEAQVSDGKFAWRLGLDYDVPGLGLIYASVATGFKDGGFNDGCESTGPADQICTLPRNALYFSPESNTAYEAGLKFRLLDNKVELNTALFHYDYSGYQLKAVTNLCGTPCQLTTNAARAKVDGAEFDSTIRLDANNRLNLAFTLLDARYADYSPLPQVSWAGKRLDRSPRVTASAGYTHRFRFSNGGSLELYGVIRLNSGYVISDFGNRVQFTQPSFHKSDVTLTYHAPKDRWYLQAFAKNLEDAIALTSVSQGLGASAVFSDPRLFGLRFGMKY
jgi:iron complex outermembrane recepter protein